MKNYISYFAPIILLAVLSHCAPKEKQVEQVNIFKSEWKGIAVINLPAGELPFNLTLVEKDGKNKAIISNGKENLYVKDEVQVLGDSLVIPGHVFESEFRVKIVANGDSLIGEYIRKNTKKPYSIPFYAVKGRTYRFWETPAEQIQSFSGSWEVNFMGDSSKAIGRFEQQGSNVTGTFLTPTGDYRFLEGQVSGNQMKLSTFDGAHAFLFTAKMNEGELKGKFYSGKDWEDDWTGVRNDSFQLPSAESLTYLMEGYEGFEYNYINEKGDSVNVAQSEFLGKVSIVQILGTWCPNCMDETMFLVPLKKKFPDVNVVGLSFERPMEYEKAYTRINKLKDLLEVNYPMYYAGIADKGVASKAFPMLNKIISFPTTIVIDKKGKVRMIHTGFSGPGTGSTYDQFSDDFYKLILELNGE